MTVSLRYSGACDRDAQGEEGTNREELSHFTVMKRLDENSLSERPPLSRRARSCASSKHIASSGPPSPEYTSADAAACAHRLGSVLERLY
jgi:hypothetical protein